jgi:hypothetical protein
MCNFLLSGHGWMAAGGGVLVAALLLLAVAALAKYLVFE